MDSRQILMIVFLHAVTVYCEDQEAAEDFNKLTVDCGFDPKEDMTLVYTGQAKAMYARTNEFECNADEPTDDREIVFKLVVRYEDREKCGVLRVGEQAFKIGIRVQVHEILVTGDDIVYDVTCNYANVTNSTVNAGKVEIFSGGPVFTNEMWNSAVRHPPAKDIELFMEDEFTNQISHASLDSPVRLHIRKTPYYQDCPEYVPTPSACDDYMIQMTTSLECGVLREGSFAECNGVEHVWESPAVNAATYRILSHPLLFYTRRICALSIGQTCRDCISKFGDWIIGWVYKLDLGFKKYLYTRLREVFIDLYSSSTLWCDEYHCALKAAVGNKTRWLVNTLQLESSQILSPESFIEDCEDFMATLSNEMDECLGFRKREYLCSLQEIYECNCHKAGVPVNWLPSSECPNKRSPIFVEVCSLINKQNSIPILHQGCGDPHILPRSWQFSSSSSLSTRTPFFRFDQFPIDVLMVNCTVQMCASTSNCEQNCSNLPKVASIDYLETRVLSTGPLYLSEFNPTHYTTDSFGNELFPDEKVAAVLDQSPDGDCGGVFNAANFPLFIAVSVLGLLTVVLVILIGCFVYRFKERRPSRQAVRGNRTRLFRGLNPSLTPSQDLYSDTLKSSNAPTMRAFCRPSTPSDHSGSESPLFNQSRSPQSCGERAEDEIAVQICPQFSPGVPGLGAGRIPPPPAPPAPSPPSQLQASRLLDSLYSEGKASLL